MFGPCIHRKSYFVNLLATIAMADEPLLFINALEFLLYSAFVIICEYRQTRFGEALTNSVCDAIFYISTVCGFSETKIGWITRFLTVVWVIFETAVWPFTGNGVTTQIVLVMTDVRYMVIARPNLIWMLALAVILVILITGIRFPKCLKLKVPIYRAWVQMISFISGLWSWRYVKYSLDPYPIIYDAVPTNPLVKNYLQEPARVGSCPNSPKNIILIHVECFELGAIGLFNTEHPNLSPNLMQLMANGTYFDNHVMDSDKAYTMGSIFSQTSGLPMLTRGTFMKGGDIIMLNPKIHTYHDYLHLCGYEQIAVCTRCCTAHRLYSQHHVEAIDASKVDRLRKDEDTFDYTMNVILPRLMRNSSRPFSLTIVNEDTHPSCTVSERCARNHPEWASLPWCLQAFNCFDETLGKFMQKLSELGLDQTTEVVIYGDHQYFGDPDFFRPPRYMTMVVPYRKMGVIKKPIKWYDLAPTILEMAGIDEYGPKFPFGNSFFDKDVAKRPTQDDHIYINNMIG